MFSLFFLLSVIVIIISSENHYLNNIPLTGHASIQVISYAKQGSELTFEIRNVKGFKDATVRFKETIKDSKVTVKENKTLFFEGIAYNKVTIAIDQEEKMDTLDINLKIKEEDLVNLKIKAHELRVYHNDKELTTIFLGEKEDYLYYRTSTTGLGNFVLGKQSKKSQSQHITTTVEKTPQVTVVAEEPKMSVDGAPFVEEKEEPLAGKAAQQEEEKSTLTRMKDFFKGLFN